MKTLLSFAAALLLAPAAAALEVAGLAFQSGAPWKEIPSSSSMRAGTLQLAIEGQEKPLEAVFFYFGAGQGGDVEANVQRWFKQFEGQPETAREEIAAGTAKVTLVTAKGTYLDGPPFGAKTPRPGSMLLGAIVPAAEAPVFIKLTGPAAAVEKALPEFRKLATSPFAKP